MEQDVGGYHTAKKNLGLLDDSSEDSIVIDTSDMSSMDGEA